MWIFGLFLVIPLVEIALFVTVGAWLTLWPTLGIVLFTGVLELCPKVGDGLK